MSKRGIDVSEHNGSLDWSAIKQDGVSFAIIRAGYGRYQTDSRFYENIEGAISNGIPVGIYWFSYALNASYAKQEAKKCMEVISGYRVTLPVFYDFEYDTVRYAKEQGVTLGKAQFNEFANAFLGEIQAAGYKPGIYYNLDYYQSMVDPVVLGSYCIWYAQYASKPSITDYAIWQYTSSGTLNGVAGNVDLNQLKDASLLAPEYTPGWHKNSIGWWYVREDGTYPTSCWEKIDDVWYYFDTEGYMLENQWVVTNGNAYYLGQDGGMVTNRTLIIDSGGKLVPGGGYYETLGQVPSDYREALERLIARGILRGKSGSGENLVLDLGEDAVRLLVMLDRSGCME